MHTPNALPRAFTRSSIMSHVCASSILITEKWMHTINTSDIYSHSYKCILAPVTNHFTNGERILMWLKYEMSCNKFYFKSNKMINLLNVNVCFLQATGIINELCNAMIGAIYWNGKFDEKQEKLKKKLFQSILLFYHMSSFRFFLIKLCTCNFFLP